MYRELFDKIMHLDNYNDEYEERDKKFEIIRKNKANILIRTYINYSIRNLYIVLLMKEGTLMI